MRTVDELFGDDSSDDYDTDEELAKVPTTTTTSRLKKVSAVPWGYHRQRNHLGAKRGRVKLRSEMLAILSVKDFR